MKAGTFQLMRVWATLTGLMLALWFLIDSYVGNTPARIVPMLATAIGGFELVLYVQDVWLRRKRRHG